jgi:hypothetical protein
MRALAPGAHAVPAELVFHLLNQHAKDVVRTLAADSEHAVERLAMRELVEAFAHASIVTEILQMNPEPA